MLLKVEAEFRRVWLGDKLNRQHYAKSALIAWFKKQFGCWGDNKINDIFTLNEHI